MPGSTAHRTLTLRLRNAAARVVDPLVLRRAETLRCRTRRVEEPPDPGPEALAVVHAQLADLASSHGDQLVALTADALTLLWGGDIGETNPPPALREATVDAFHRLYYHTGVTTWQQTTYRGVTIWKCPLDLWLYQEIVHKVRPTLIVETGTAFGGSAYYLGDLCTTLGLDTRIVSIDIAPQRPLPEHPKVTYLQGSSVDPAIVDTVYGTRGEGPVLVILDSDHSRDHVLSELRTWAPWVTPGSYVIVEDTNVNGHPALGEFGPGPMEAVEDYLKECDDFDIDATQEKFYMTFNPRGFLRRR